ncbi:MAG: valine--tRNA ligase [Oscillospiraceae bacterium]
MKELDKIYNPKEVEDRTYKNWLDKGYFRAEVDKNKKPYTIVMPPPNITGKLHMGHALNNTIQDVIIRYKRMDGFSALWVPGTDHASIATEAKIVEDMAKENLTKEDLGRDDFLKRSWIWKEKYGTAIVDQLKKIGSSCDWSRERFTLDEGCSHAVKEVFVKLYDENLIYKGERIINWCPNCLTSISDAEVEFLEKDGNLYNIKYKVEDEDIYLTLATTRPETLLGDTAVAVNPNDDRYKYLVGKMVEVPFTNRVIPIIEDSYVDIEFGTGVVKITPAHDPNDYEVGLRHQLPIINIMTEDAVINENGGIYEGLTRYEARNKIVEDLKAINLLNDIESRQHNVGTCYRCSTVIEPRISNQWFVKMKDLSDPSNAAVRKGEVKFIPERLSKTYFNWMDNVKDWCISRQLWWGHRIPAFYCEDCGHITVTKNEHVDCCEKCNSNKIKQDEDTLDTWFSSALWPFSTLGWPEETEDSKYFYPTNTLVTGYDIIFFWVARMIFSGLYNTNKLPFKTVFFNGLVRDDKGKKMSKSSGIGVDPLEIIDTYGADALRFSLVKGNSPGNDIRFSDDKIIANRNFANKIWNAARFIMMNIDDTVKPCVPDNLQIEDKWILTELNNLIKEYRDNLEKFEIGLAASKIYEFSWDIFCDWYIEIVKTRLNNKDKNCQSLIVYIFNNILKLIHPFMPFITEEIYTSLPNNSESIMMSKFPVFEKSMIYIDEYNNFKAIMESIKIIRNIRSEMNVPRSKKADLYIETNNKDTYNENKSFYENLAFASNVFVDSKFSIENTVGGVFVGGRVILHVGDLVDTKKEFERLNKEKKKVEKDVEFLSKKLNNDGFLSKAPQTLIDEENKKLKIANEKLLKINESLNNLDK